MKILITSCAGYIGSHIAKQLLETTQYDIIGLDNLSTGYIKTIRDFEFIKIDLKEFNDVNLLLKPKLFDVIIHSAASSIVSESVENPLKYCMNNTVNTTNLIKCVSEHGIKNFIFSTTTSLYGEPKESVNIDETIATHPLINMG